MGFFDGVFDDGKKELVTHQKTKRYGRDATRALQPGMFNAWRNVMGSGGVPFMGDLSTQIDDAYARAAKQAGALGAGESGAAIGSDIAQRGGIAGDLLRGGVGVQGQQNMLNTAGQAAGYLGNLTSGRTQYGFLGGYKQPSDWDVLQGGLNTLSEGAALIGPAFGLPTWGEGASRISQGMPLGNVNAPGSTPVGGGGNPLAGQVGENMANMAGGLDASRTPMFDPAYGESIANIAGGTGQMQGAGVAEFLRMLPFF